MSVVERSIGLVVDEQAIADSALEELRVFGCSGKRCPGAKEETDKVALMAQEQGMSPHQIRADVHKRVGGMCITRCTEEGIEPLGTDYDKSQIDAILEGRID